MKAIGMKRDIMKLVRLMDDTMDMLSEIHRLSRSLYDTYTTGPAPGAEVLDRIGWAAKMHWQTFFETQRQLVDEGMITRGDMYRRREPKYLHEKYEDQREGAKK